MALATPSLQGRHVYLRAPTPDDYPLLHRMETSSAVGPSWRLRGATPPPDQWAQAMTQGVLAQFLVVGRKTNSPVGIVTAYQPMFQDRHANVAAARFDPRHRSPAMIFGFAIFLQYVFGCWDLRKLYMEVAEYNFPQFESGLGRFFELEGRLREHLYLGGKYWDQLQLAIYRDRWQEQGAKLLRSQGLA